MFNLENAISLANDLISRLEKFEQNAYLDGAGIPTIGFGTTSASGIIKVSLGMTCTHEQAKTWLSLYIKKDAERLVAWCLKNVVELAADNEAAAILSFTYNASFSAFVGSSMAKQIKSGNFQAAALAFERWDKIRINGKLTFSKGLFNRRMQEENCFIDEAAC